MKQLLLFTAIVFLATAMHAMPSKILVYGYVEEGNLDALFGNKRSFPTRLDDVHITISCDGEILNEKVNRTSGFYSFVLTPGKKYSVSFSAEGFFPKCVDFNTIEAPLGEQESSFKMFTDIMLFERIPIEDDSIFTKAAMAKCEFDPTKNRMVWDMNYAKIAFDHFMRITGYEKDFITQ
ncbi:MAG: hypothetical protein ACI84C_002056 [Flavobacteriales bacterium]|jgi:hypothetical protein